MNHSRADTLKVPGATGVGGYLVALPRPQLAVLPGTTHVGLVERAGWLLSMIDEFLDAPMPEAELSTDSSGTR